ncbi:MAG: KTSC domain-containing protein [Cyanobacteria bacterium RM1_2_2]|nr:KTSC domain-containing protein [Cyanobacteria bacterium RM1_2_2]
MELHWVESSMIQAFGYDAEKQTLLVIFNTGKTYRYFNVPSEVYEGLMRTDSKGSYMRSLVIDQYPYELAKQR